LAFFVLEGGTIVPKYVYPLERAVFNSVEFYSTLCLQDGN